MNTDKSFTSLESSSVSFAEELEVLIRARYSLIGIQTWEEDRAAEIIRSVSQTLNKRVFGWSISRGLTAMDSESSRSNIDSSTTDPQAALRKIQDLVDPAVFIFFDFHPYLRDSQITRMLREVVKNFKNSLKTLLLISPNLEVPLEVEKDVTILNLELPKPGDLGLLLDDVVDAINRRGDLKISLTSETREKLIQATIGLTLAETENVLAKAIVSQKGLSLDALKLIIAEKEQIIRRAGVLEFYGDIEKFDEIGGLDYLKDWLRKRKKSFSGKAEAFGLPAPKGILLIGVQGCGKSLTAKAVAGYWGYAAAETGHRIAVFISSGIYGRKPEASAVNSGDRRSVYSLGG